MSYRMPKAEQRPKVKSCPLITIVGHSNNPTRTFHALAKIDGSLQRVGYVGLADEPPATKGGLPQLVVIEIAVQPELNRCGVGTKLYAKAAQVACDEGRVLTSDTSRTKCSDGFWKKQVVKKRAKCVAKGSGPKGTHWADESPGCGGPAYNRSGCSFYQLTKPCPTTLDGFKRRR